MKESLKASRPSVKLLLLGDPATDRRAKNFISSFVELGFDVTLIYAIPGKNNSGLSIISNVTAKQLPLGSFGGVKMFLEFDTLLFHELQDSSTSTTLFACDLYSLRAASKSKKLKRTKYLIYDARELYTELPSVAGNFLKKLYWRRWERSALRRTDLVVVTAPDDVDAIRHVHGFLPPTVLVRNLPAKQAFVRDDYLRQYFSIPAAKNILVYVGGIQKERGLEKMIRVMPRLRDRAVFVMIGDGTIKPELVSIVKDQNVEDCVYFHPATDSEKIVHILSSADVGISLIELHSRSYQLALPSKVFEYLLAGLTVISSPLKQVKDLFIDNEAILYADPDDENEILERCNEAIDEAGDAELKKKIHDMASEEFTFDVDTKSFGEALEMIIPEKKFFSSK